MSAALRRLALRDLAIALATCALWGLDARLRVSGGAAAVAVALATGAATALCGYLVHEWGHLAGALSARAVVHPGRTLRSTFLFRFDTARNGREQFLRMSLGGFAASAAAVAALLALLPLDALSGRAALALVGLGVVATFVLEVPVALRVARGAPLPSGAAYESSGGSR
jgi:hypothetical protein